MKKMTKDEFLKIQNQDHFISGIHNYCDKWCERCPKSQFCSVFAMEAEFKSEAGEGVESKNQGDSLSVVGNMFEIVSEMIQEMMEKENFVFSDADIEESKVEIKKERNFTENHQLSKLGMDYFLQTNKILEQNQDFFKTELEKIINIFASDKKQELLTLSDSFEIIRWYCTMIPAKLSRGVANLFDADQLEEDWEKDELLGTFKVALISVQRSMVAWAKVLETFPEIEDDILPILVLLEKIHKQIILVCPESENHQRLGFER